jgi:hypothetical protein
MTLIAEFPVADSWERGGLVFPNVMGPILNTNLFIYDLGHVTLFELPGLLDEMLSHSPLFLHVYSRANKESHPGGNLWIPFLKNKLKSQLLGLNGMK